MTITTAYTKKLTDPQSGNGSRRVRRPDAVFGARSYSRRLRWY